MIRPGDGFSSSNSFGRLSRQAHLGIEQVIDLGIRQLLMDQGDLASALVARDAVPELALLTLDRRVQAAARELGFRLLPESAV